MRRRALPLLSAAVVCLIAGLAWGQVKVDLTYQDFKDASDPLADTGRQWTSRLGTKPPVKGAPDGLSDKAAYFRIQMSGKRVLFVIDPTDPPKLYLDSNIDLDFSGEEAVTGQKINDEQCRFGPLTIKDPKDTEGPELRFAVNVYSQNGRPAYAMLTAPGSYAGTAKLGGKDYGVALVDGNLDGRCTGRTGLPRGQAEDMLAIDHNQDGCFQSDAFEIMPIGKMARVGGAYYDVAVEADASAITFTPSSVPLGTLKAASPAVALSLTWPEGTLFLEKTESAWQVPAGRYVIDDVRLSAADKDGNLWSLGSLRLPSRLAHITIEEGKETALNLGPPCLLKTNVIVNKRNVSIGLTMTGQAGEPYLAAATKNGQQLDPPRIRIVDENGKELGTAAFGFG